MQDEADESNPGHAKEHWFHFHQHTQAISCSQIIPQPGSKTACFPATDVRVRGYLCHAKVAAALYPDSGKLMKM